MADSSQTPPPKDVVTTRTPTPVQAGDPSQDGTQLEERTATPSAQAPPPTEAASAPTEPGEPEETIAPETTAPEVTTEQPTTTPPPTDEQPSAGPAETTEQPEVEPPTQEVTDADATAADVSEVTEKTEPGVAAEAPSVENVEPAAVAADQPESAPAEETEKAPEVEGSEAAPAGQPSETGDKELTPAATPAQLTGDPEASTPPQPPKQSTPTPAPSREQSQVEPSAVTESREGSLVTPTALQRTGSVEKEKTQTSIGATEAASTPPKESTPPKQSSPPKEPAPTKEPTPLKEPTKSPSTLSQPPAAEVSPSTAQTDQPPPPPGSAQTREPTLVPAAQTPAIEDQPYPRDETLSRMSEGDDSNIITGNAMSVVWSFGLNKNVPMVNLSTDERCIIMYTCAHTGIAYDFENNTQKLLQGHNSNIACTCVSEDKRWLATADAGSSGAVHCVIVWDTSNFFPVQTIFDAGDQGVVAMALTPDARYLATISAGNPQVLAIWDWTVEGDRALCSATLDPSYGIQDYVLFNPDNTTQIVSNSESQAIFYAWEDGVLKYFCPPLTDDDFNKPVGKYTQSIFLQNTNKAVTATSIGNLVVWASNKPLTKAVDDEPTPNKKALKLVKVQERGINVLMTSDSLIVMGDMNGHVKFFDQSLNLIHWYQDLNVGPINAISFTYIEKWGIENTETKDYPSDCSLESKSLTLRDFTIGSTQSVYALITPKGTDINVILRSHDSPIHTVITHPSEAKLFIGSYSGILQLWNYEIREVVASRKFERGSHIQCAAIDPQGEYLAVGFTNGTVKILDALNLLDVSENFRYARDAITLIKFSHDSQYLACADGEFTTTLFKHQTNKGPNNQPWIYVGRHKAHYKPVQDLMFGVHLDNDLPRLLTLGKDRMLVEYDLENSSKDNLQVSAWDRIEQSAVPQCMAWYPPLNKEHFIVTANDQFKFKLYNVTTKRCRKIVLGPTYGSPLKKICIMPTAPGTLSKYLAYINQDKVGLQILPLDGNPHNSTALVAHPSGVSDLVPSYDGKYIFTAGGTDTSVHMWHVNLNALEAQSKLGGEGLIPFYGLMEGGREGELFAELEDYFYYAQLRSQSINTMMQRQVATRIPLSEVPFVMRAMGFYPTEQEVEDMLNEVRFSRYVETGEDVTDIDLEDFIKLYVNHRPAFGLSLEKIAWCFDVLAGKESEESAIKRGHFLDLLQRKGEHMTEYELSEHLTTLLGYNEEGGSCEQQQFDASQAGNIIIDNLPTNISTRAFTDDLLGFGMFEEPDVLVVNE